MNIIILKNNHFNKNTILKILKNNICFIGIFSDYCVHCIAMKSEWIKLKRRLTNKPVNIILIEINANVLNNINYPPLTTTINGFPHIVLSKYGKEFINYNGNRSCNAMYNFFKPYILKKKKTKTKPKFKPKRRSKGTRKLR